MIRRRFIGSGLFLLAIIALLTGTLAWMGYFSRDPVTLFPAAGADGRSKPVAVLFLSGDMGIRVGMGPKVTAGLAREGMPVVAVNSLSYFRRERSPAEISAMIAAGIDRARSFGGTDNVVLVGQSFGADMIHIGLVGLPAAQRKYIRMVALVVPTMPIYRQISVGEYSGWATAEAQASETTSRLNWAPVLCVYGAKESDSACPGMTMANVRRVALPGGHRLNFDLTRLIGVLRRAIDQSLKKGSA